MNINIKWASINLTIGIVIIHLFGIYWSGDYNVLGWDVISRFAATVFGAILGASIELVRTYNIEQGE